MCTDAPSRSAGRSPAGRTSPVSTVFLAATLAAAIAVAACASAPSRDEPVAGYSRLPGDNPSAGLVLSGPDLQEHDGDLLTFLAARVSGLSVDKSGFPCPRVDMRGRKSLVGASDPAIYVDGARAANTCILQMLATRAVNRVEVYPMGITSRPGYKSHPNGLILIFMDAERTPEP